uniref:Uncharacterized protein n=1 Tax=Lepeophtheirus salmonis TaxID=72036 RepID=A0A0K2TZA7_LEPSM
MVSQCWLTDALRGLGIWMTDTAGVPLDINQKGVDEEVRIKVVGGQKSLVTRRWVSFITGFKSGLSTLTWIFHPLF